METLELTVSVHLEISFTQDVSAHLYTSPYLDTFVPLDASSHQIHLFMNIAQFI